MTILFHVTHSTAFPRGWDYDKDSAPKYMKVKGKMNRCKKTNLPFHQTKCKSWTPFYVASQML